MSGRNVFVCTTLLILVGSLSVHGPVMAGEPAPMALINGTLIDGTGADPVPNAVIIVQEGQIAAIGTRDSVSIPADAQVIDVGGATILPGFINAHVHESFSASHLSAWVQAGVTTVRDLGAHPVLDWQHDLPSGAADSSSSRLEQTLIDVFAVRDVTLKSPDYARIVAAGPFVNRPGSYGGLVYPVSSAEEATQAVTHLREMGADLIKTAYEDGTSRREHYELLSQDELNAIVKTAHDLGVPVSMHITLADAIGPALDAGVDDLAHMVVDDLPDDMITRVVEAGVYWTPTLELWHGVSEAHHITYDQIAIANLRRFVEAGGMVALGTDYAGYFTPFELGMPITELELMQEAGMTPMQIIVAATQNAAHVCNLESEIGTLEVGKIADILVVDGDPLVDIHALLDVRYVLHYGVIIRSPK